jgi:hypothetical protein
MSEGGERARGTRDSSLSEDGDEDDDDDGCSWVKSSSAAVMEAGMEDGIQTALGALMSSCRQARISARVLGFFLGFFFVGCESGARFSSLMSSSGLRLRLRVSRCLSSSGA